MSGHTEKKTKKKLPELKTIKAKNEVITEEDMRNISGLKEKRLHLPGP